MKDFYKDLKTALCLNWDRFTLHLLEDGRGELNLEEGSKDKTFRGSLSLRFYPHLSSPELFRDRQRRRVALLSVVPLGRPKGP